MKKFLSILLCTGALALAMKTHSQNYNPATVETLTGEIVRIDKVQGRRSAGIHLSLKTDKETISVHVGPEWYLSRQNVVLKVNDRIEVKGSRIIYNKKPAIVAAEIKKGNSLLVLRDANGTPAWSRRKQIEKP